MKVKRKYKVWGIVGGVLLILVISGLVGASGCGEESATTESYGEGQDGAKAAGVAVDELAASPEAEYRDVGTQSSTDALPSAGAGDGQKVIKDAVMSIEVGKGEFQSAFNQAQMLAVRYGGYVLSSNAYAGSDEESIKSGQVTISVLSESFEKAKADAAKLGEVKGQSDNTQNVTEEYVDLQARVRNQQAYVDSIQALLAKANTIDEILQVQQTLSYAQEQLEVLKGRLQYLDSHTTHSTLTVNIYEAGTEVVAPSEGWGFVQALRDAAHNLVDAFSAVARGLGWILPVLVIVGVLAGIVYVTVKAATRRDGKRRQDGEDKTA